MRYIISFVSNIPYSIFPFKQCRKAKGLGNRILVLSLGMTTPPVTLVTELDLGLFFLFCFFTRLCPSLIPLYTHFIIIITYYYQLYFVEFTPWKRQNELSNHFLEGHLCSIKFTIDLVSHVLHSLLETVVTVSVVKYNFKFLYEFFRSLLWVTTFTINQHFSKIKFRVPLTS